MLRLSRDISAPINVLTPNEESIVDVGKNFFEFYLKTHQEFRTNSIFPDINHQSSFLTKVMLREVSENLSSRVNRPKGQEIP